jgi:FAD/FMN-containing dehydrogenase
MNAIAVDPKAGTAAVGAGASLGSLYQAIVKTAFDPHNVFRHAQSVPLN